MRAGESGGRLVWLIALERSLRGILLVAAGIYLIAKAGSNFSDLANHLARRIELDPQRPWIRHLIAKLGRLRKHEVKVFGAGAIAYGVLELVEGGGLFYRKRWAEWLTVIATSLVEGYFHGDVKEAHDEFKKELQGAGFKILFDELEEHDSEVSWKGEGRTGQVALREECGWKSS